MIFNIQTVLCDALDPTPFGVFSAEVAFSVVKDVGEGFLPPIKENGLHWFNWYVAIHRHFLGIYTCEGLDSLEV